jgi:hypothetical protein
MSTIEIVMIVALAIMFVGSYVVTRFNRDLTVENTELRKKLDIAEDINKSAQKLINDLDKKTKLSNDVLAVLNDMKQGGAVIEVTRIDRSDIFFHNGGVYR